MISKALQSPIAIESNSNSNSNYFLYFSDSNTVDGDDRDWDRNEYFRFERAKNFVSLKFSKIKNAIKNYLMSLGKKNGNESGSDNLNIISNAIINEEIILMIRYPYRIIFMARNPSRKFHYKHWNRQTIINVS